ncbi:MAG: hypothetical protein JWO57_2437 [Pseudonocardiales bacterium]|nr:hypothetical protein [Pseudonocardiales bacterium]
MTREEWVLLIAQVLGTLGTLAALWVAVLTVRRGSKQARAAENAMLRERRIDFQLGVLRDLAQANLRPDGSDVAIGHLKLLAAMLPVHMVPFARVMAGLETTQAAGELRDRTADRLKENACQDWSTYPVWGAFQQQIQDELVVAAGKLVRERD